MENLDREIENKCDKETTELKARVEQSTNLQGNGDPGADTVLSSANMPAGFSEGNESIGEITTSLINEKLDKLTLDSFDTERTKDAKLIGERNTNSDNINLQNETNNAGEGLNCDTGDTKQDSIETKVHENKVDSDQEYFSDQSESGDEYESAEEGEEMQTDSTQLKELEEQLTEEDKLERQSTAKELKDEGNQLFKDGSYKSAIRMYSRGLRTCPLKYEKDRAVLYANRAACKVKLEEFEEAIRDCSKAIDLNPEYMRALMRRADLYEKTEKLDEALTDYQKILELDPSYHPARAACLKLPDMIKERNEKLKEEMMGKLKELGNMVLRPFGLSTNNFQMNQDPNTGGYSVNFVQGANSS